jgi:hypothetical protein
MKIIFFKIANKTYNNPNLRNAYKMNKKKENEEHAFNMFHKLWVFFGCILSQIYWVESQLRFEFE